MCYTTQYVGGFMDNDDLQNYLLKDYLDEDVNVSCIIDDMKNWARKLPPLVAGTALSVVLSNPTFIGVGGIILILQELGIDTYNLIKINKSSNIDVPLLTEVNNYKNKKGLYNNDTACLERILYEIDMTVMVYDMELVIKDEELKIIINNIMNMIKEKGYDNLKYSILCYYYKKSIANVISNDENQVDYYSFMNGINYLIDIKTITKKDIEVLVKRIVKNLNNNYKEEKVKVIKFKR